MARKENDLTTCMITQALHRSYWDLEEDALKVIDSGDLKAITDLIVQRLTANQMVVEECYGIIHDKDTQVEWNESTLCEEIVYKTHHIHVVVKFQKGDTLSKIASTLGLQSQFIEKPKRGRYAYDNMLAYLIHVKYPNKAQYSVDDVYTACGTSYNKVAHERNSDWLKGRATVKVKQAKADIDWLEEQVLCGALTKQQILLTDEYYNIYSHNKRRVDDAFDTYGQRKIYKTMQAMENGEFKVSVLFITGQPHSGKSTFTDGLVKGIQKTVKERTGDTWSVCTCASSNPFDEYNGEEILVMDDLRGVSLNASDWLKLLDPDRINKGSARYRNKAMACRVIVINSERDVLEFFYFTKNIGGQGRSEAMDQFFRRILAKVVVYRVPNDMKTRMIHVGKMKESDEYSIVVPGTNDVVNLHHEFNAYGSNGLSWEDALEYLTEIVMSNNKGAYITDTTKYLMHLYSGEIGTQSYAEMLDAFEYPNNKDVLDSDAFEKKYKENYRV